MNRILKHRFNQISRQNNFLFTTREHSLAQADQAPAKMTPVKSTPPPTRQPVELRRD